MDFVNFDDALKRLGIAPERLNQLREDGELRAYRDGASWKFRADEIERMASDGIPEAPPPSDAALPRLDEMVDAATLGDLASLEEELQLVDDDQSELDLELGDLEDTVTALEGDAKNPGRLPHVDEPSDPSDSILLSDETLGESAPAPPSTIIGKKELASKDADLELVTDDDLAPGSDVKLTAGASNVLTTGVAGSGVLDDAGSESSHARAFEKLEELEIDLAAESSRVLNPQEAEDLRERVVAAKNKPPKADSDLELADLNLAADDEGTDPVPTDLEPPAKKTKAESGPSSDLELATDEDDFVLAEAGGSDITLDSADSGINLIEPSDSGLALDDISLESGGSAILDSLSSGKSKGRGAPKPDSDIGLLASDSNLGGDDPLSTLQTDDDFRLTPLGDAEDEGDSSSQVIALDAGLDDLGGEEAGILGEDAFTEEDVEGVALTDDFQDAGGPMAGVGYGVVAAPRSDGDYSLWNVIGLGSAMLLLLLAVIVTTDLLRNIWSWDQNLALNDSMLDGLLGLFGLR